MKITKTISGAMESIPNLTHNSREHIPPNSVEERRYRNVYFDNDGIGLKEVYDKLFEKSYQEWREKQIAKSRGDRCPVNYYEKIRQDKQKHLKK